MTARGGEAQAAAADWTSFPARSTQSPMKRR
ncbi:hypothetical protein LILAB_25645 [Corallococcus macrosporus]|uniref:Uncharacterized protein n=1 Tax=Myxococcus fulvus (strain ATCC BAA-855 / HW-1) TaxID=483219 RepID=F8C9C2_MYXFH|nr:hypothetical protein LILAB_25645 [Corallococcus macrosporus]